MPSLCLNKTHIPEKDAIENLIHQKCGVSTQTEKKPKRNRDFFFFLFPPPEGGNWKFRCWWSMACRLVGLDSPFLCLNSWVCMSGLFVVDRERSILAMDILIFFFFKFFFCLLHHEDLGKQLARWSALHPGLAPF